MSTTVQYHADRAAYPARPAINVKVHCAGADFWPDGSVFPQAGTAGENDRDYDAIIGAAYERVQSDFWQAATEIAEQKGLGEITQEGRSGGWLVFTTPGLNPVALAEIVDEYDADDPDDAEGLVAARAALADWLAAYRSMVEWADAWIADAPRKVRDLSQQLAMDEAGEPAARRMFAFGRTA